MTAKKASKSSAKVASATTSRTGQVGGAETTITNVEDANDKAAAASKRQADAPARAKTAPARAGHATSYPRKSMEAKFGPAKVTDEQKADVTRRQAVLGGI